jgi:Transport and Golgi organisation 2
MCVLTYIPLGDSGFVVTSNRDENEKRKRAIHPKKIKFGKKEIICPIDPASNGTWIGTSKLYTMVLLNGAYKNHKSTPPYRQSRGRVIPDFLKIESPKSFFEIFEFQNMEPFTLVLFENQNRNKITEIRWDSIQKSIQEFDGTNPKIWSSATLYNEKAIKKRSNWFFTHLLNNELSANSVLKFHHEGGSFDKYDSIKLKRENGIQTQCITQIEIQTTEKTMFFEEIDSKNKSRYLIL